MFYKYDNRNILRDDSGHLKVADFGVSKLLKVANTVKEDRPVTSQETSCKSSTLGKNFILHHHLLVLGGVACELLDKPFVLDFVEKVRGRLSDMCFWFLINGSHYLVVYWIMCQNGKRKILVFMLALAICDFNLN